MSERGRPRSFDRQEALTAAMLVFWAKGFENASMTDLTRAMGIASPSLYAAFGSKEALFVEAVELYKTTIGVDIWAALESESTIAAALEAFLMRSACAFTRRETPPGCLIVLGARPSEGGEAGGLLKDHRDGNRVDVRRRFQRAVDEGELPSDFDSDGAAAFYVTLQHGMSLMARDGADTAMLLAVARNGVAALDGLKRHIVTTLPGC